MTSPEAKRTYLYHTDNLVLVPVVKHYLITADMNRIDDKTGRRIREIVKDEPAGFQAFVGLHLLKVRGVIQ
jgi:hypothetical protein